MVVTHAPTGETHRGIANAATRFRLHFSPSPPNNEHASVTLRDVPHENDQEPLGRK